MDERGRVPAALTEFREAELADGITKVGCVHEMFTLPRRVSRCPPPETASPSARPAKYRALIWSASRSSMFANPRPARSLRGPLDRRTIGTVHRRERLARQSASSASCWSGSRSRRSTAKSNTTPLPGGQAGDELHGGIERGPREIGRDAEPGKERGRCSVNPACSNCHRATDVQSRRR